MNGYTANTAAPRDFIDLYNQAVALVQKIPEPRDQLWRCHEVVRAVQRCLRVPNSVDVVVRDGRYCRCNHTWLELHQGVAEAILDVYSVARVPMVQLCMADAFSVRGFNELYVGGAMQYLRAEDVYTLEGYMRAKPENVLAPSENFVER